VNRLLLRVALVPILFGLFGLHRRSGSSGPDASGSGTAGRTRSRSPLPGRSHADDARATRERLSAARVSNTSAAPRSSPDSSTTSTESTEPAPDYSSVPHHTEPWPDPMDLQVADISPMNAHAHVNEAYIVTFEDGSQGLYKPVSGETSKWDTIPPSGMAAREVAASVVDRHLGLGLTPSTTMWNGPDGPGSLQRMAMPNSPSNDPADYTTSEQQRMAVFDYVIGNSDRHTGNYLTGENGGIVPIDHGLAFPLDENSFDRGQIRGIRSDFVANEYGLYLDRGLVLDLERVDSDQLGDDLSRLGLEDAAVDGAISRLDEIRESGGITGAAWPGRITEVWAKYVIRETNP
jgi:hypothetical protein